MAKFATNASSAIWWTNLQPTQAAPPGSDWDQFESILEEKYFLSYILNTLGPLCLWQCFVVILYFCIFVVVVFDVFLDSCTYSCISIFFLCFCVFVLDSTVFCIYVLQYLCIVVFLYFCVSVFLYFCTSMFLYFCISLCLNFCIEIDKQGRRRAGAANGNKSPLWSLNHQSIIR